MKFHEVKICLVAIALLAFGNFGGSVLGQTQRQGQPATQKLSRPGFSLRVASGDLLILSLKAEKTPLVSIASELSTKLEVPVLLGASVAKLEVTTDFKKLTLEPAMHMLAPVVYIDYEVNHAPGQQPRPVGIYLGGYTDPPPAINATVANKSLVYAFEGNTEEGMEESSSARDRNEKDSPLQVSYEANALTVKAKQQPLNIVLYRIATEIGIPLEIRDDNLNIIDLDINKLPLEDAVSRLTPNVRLYVRADLQRAKRTPFRMVLVAPDKRS